MMGKVSNASALVEGNRTFALDLYSMLRYKDGNILFSPYSISLALAMTYAGAEGNTKKQMSEVLHFSLEGEQLHSTFSHLTKHLNSIENKGKVELTIANALWVQKNYPFLDGFIKLIDKYYEARLHPVDFATGDLEAICQKINGWVAQETKSKIKELIQRGMLDPLTRIVLTNALYFKGKWAMKFDEHLTEDQPFWVGGNKKTKVAMMNQEELFNYMENDIVQVLELPYEAHDLSMVIVLPKERDGITELENLISQKRLDAWLTKLSDREVNIFLPRFKTTSTFELSEALISLGMRDAFTYPGANFSGMDGTKELVISMVIHKAFVGVDEKGTEAAAATAVLMTLGTAAPVFSQPIEFRADHPFIFFIRDNLSKSILFFGRIVDPR